MLSSSTQPVTRGLPPPSWEVRALAADRWPSFYAAVLGAFRETEPQEATDLWRSLAEPHRCVVIEDRGAIAGTAGAFSFRMTVPGGRLVDTAGVSMVSVQPDCRRRGVLSTLMRHQLESLQRLGEPLAVLTASEAPIYGRFGYGVAARQLSLDIASRRVRLTAPPSGETEVELTVEDPHKALAACEEFYAHQVPLRPAMLARSDGWELLPLLDPPAWRHGASPLECVVARMAGEVVGYARYTVAVDWSRTNTAEGTVRVRDIEARDPRAYAALWRFLLETDLTSRVIAVNRPVDDPFLHLVSDVRHCTPTVLDSLYVRVVDAPVALSARTYATGLDLVLEIEDALAPWNQGRWRLSGDGTGAVCTRTQGTPDLSLDASALGSAYLGGTTLTELAGAGRVREHRPGALTAATAAFASPTAPWLPHAFCRSLLPRL
ncbi:GNAT family N-acetyltransferase [Streptomyces sp. NPDC007861]|uniref:GNAT family N-acetyltransferase n=1 Tax=Streptomyces sp. NPDC007861 TaxID=3154893 RepID=UPI00340D67F8